MIIGGSIDNIIGDLIDLIDDLGARVCHWRTPRLGRRHSKKVTWGRAVPFSVLHGRL